MITYKGKTALITGASSGIGEAFARELAGRGTNLILVARSEQKLQAVATELTTQFGVQVEVVPADLSQEHSVPQIYAHLMQRNLKVDLLVNNAGFATYGVFEQIEAAQQHQEILLNIDSVVAMSHAFLPQMVQRSEGAIINVASSAAFQPAPYMAVYAATKAFVLSFTEALWAENRQRGVRVLALCPGVTATGFYDAAGAQALSEGKRSTPQQVVKVALKALENNRSFVIPGTQNYWLAQLPRLLPRRRIALFAAQALRPKAPQS